MDQSHDQAEIVLGWREKPWTFVEDLFGVSPEPWQRDASSLLVNHDRVAIKSGHGVGKSCWLAWTIIWWLLTRYPAKVMATANTVDQLSDVLWGEIDKWHRRMPEGMRSLIEINSEKVVVRENPKECFAAARTARRENPEAFQGRHSENMLFIADEASGIDDIIFETGRGAMASHGAKTILTGNPTRTTGYFFDAFHKNRAIWATMTVPCTKSRQVPQKYIEDCAEEYGDDSNMYRVRVLGEFPIEGDDIIIPMHLIESAVNRDVAMIDNAEITWGLDVARFGDDRTALAKRKANHLLEPVKWWKGKDGMQVAGLVVNEYKEAEALHMAPDIIYVDAIGYGAIVADRLGEVGIPAYCVNVAETPPVGDKFMRQRDELWWRGREWFRSLTVKIPNDDRLMGELSMPTYSFTSGGKIKAESKDEVKKRTSRGAGDPGKSPDIADAFLLTFAGGQMVPKRVRAISYPAMGIV